MRLKAFVALAVVVAGLFSGFGVGTVKAPTLTITETQITTNTATQGDPAIHGNIIVWRDNRYGLWGDIYMYDLSTGTETRITTVDTHERDPAIYGDRIVWTDSRNGNWDIYMYDLVTSTETRITTIPATQGWPAIYGDRIVWADDRNAPPAINDIYMYDLTTGTETQITTSGTAMNPAIYGDRIVWEDDRNGFRDIYMYDLSTGAETQITTNTAAQGNPAIYGDRIVWEDDRNGFRDIYMYDLSTGAETQITTSGATQWDPAIYGDRIIWTDYRNGGFEYADIYMYDLSTEVETQVTTNPASQIRPAIYGNLIVWQDARNEPGDIYPAYSNWDIYLGELSFPPTPSDAIEQTENIENIVSDSTQIPTSDFSGSTDRVKNNRRNAFLNRLDAVIMDIETAMASTDPSTQRTAYQSAIDQLNSLLEKTDGCSERGTPDTEGSNYTPDWITTCESQAIIDPLIRNLITTLQTLLAQIP